MAGAGLLLANGYPGSRVLRRRWQQILYCHRIYCGMVSVGAHRPHAHMNAFIYSVIIVTNCKLESIRSYIAFSINTQHGKQTGALNTQWQRKNLLIRRDI